MQFFRYVNKKHLIHLYLDDEEDETEFQTSKIKSLQIKPINESHNQIDSSVDELRNAIGHINIQRSSTFEKDPWWPSTSTAGNDIAFSHSLKTVQPMRHAFTGDDSMNRKFLEFNYPNQTMPSPNFDFSQSTNFTTGISRARPRSQMTASSSNVNSGQNLMGKKVTRSEILSLKFRNSLVVSLLLTVRWEARLDH